MGCAFVQGTSTIGLTVTQFIACINYEMLTLMHVPMVSSPVR